MLLPRKNTKLFGLNDIKDRIIQEYESGKLHHSILLYGNKGIGKATLAYHIANKFLEVEKKEESSDEFSLFGDIAPKVETPKNDGLESNPAYKLIAEGSHPDLLVIEKLINPKTGKEDKEIKVDAVREINDFIILTSSISKNKVIIIDAIDEMNISAQNSLLKNLEEPKDNTYFLLVCNDKNKILETINSRCREIKIPNLKYEDWKEALLHSLEGVEYKNLSSDSALQSLSLLSFNSVYFAQRLIENDGLSFYDSMLSIFLKNGLDTDIKAIQNFADVLNGDDKFYNLFNYFFRIFFDRLIKFKMNILETSFISENEKKVLEIFANKNSIDYILKKFDYANGILQDIDRYSLSKKHCITVLFTKILIN